MPSDNKTPNIGLNQWKGNEYPKREDFVNDNSIIDTELKDIQDKVQNVTIGADNKPAYEYLTVGTRGTGVVGTNSFTSGTDNIALGANSQAEGWLTKATADQSHAEGQNSQATGNSSHAEGQGTVAGSTGTVNISSDTAAGYFTHAEGNGTKASGNAAHSEGRGTTASGDYSHVEGENNAAIGRGSHAEGGATRAVLNYAHSEGYLTAAIALNSHAEGTAAYALESSHAEGVLTFAGYGTLYKITAFNNINKTITLENVTGLAVGDKLQILREDHQSTVIYDVPISAISGLVVTLSIPITIISAWKYVVKTLVGGYPTHAEGRLTKAVGYDSHAEGLNTIASGSESHAEGAGAIASGNVSHAEGSETKATGNYSHAEGNNNTTYGANSHAEGIYNEAIGAHSHAEGYSNRSVGDASHTEGSRNVAINFNGHAEGDGNWAGQIAHAEGYGNFAGVGTAFAITAFNNTNKTVTLDKVSGLAVGELLQIRRMPVGAVPLYQVPITAISGLVVTLNTTSTIDSTWKHVVKIIDSQAVHAEGYGTLALAPYSHSEGYMTRALGTCSHVEGVSNLASGNYSHAEGESTNATATGAHAEGYNTTASADHAHAEGQTTVASGLNAHAENYYTVAAGIYSHAGGALAEANADRSFAHGLGVKANGNDQFVFGRYNAPNASDLLIVGNGTSDVGRSNALRVDPYGNVISVGGFYGAIIVNNIALASGFTAVEACVTDRVGRHVELQFYITGAIPAGAWTTIGTIPNVADRPFRAIRGTCNGSTGLVGSLVIYADGVITVQFTAAQGALAGHVSYFQNT